MTDKQIGSLEEEAQKRRERLKNLKRKREGKNGSEEAQNGTESLQLPKPVFRSYKPVDEELNKNVLPSEGPADVTKEVKEQLESAKAQVVINNLDVSTLAPRKPDWDLKRDVKKKLEKLERRTQKAIAELIRDRLKERNEDLAAIVNVNVTEIERES